MHTTFSLKYLWENIIFGLLFNQENIKNINYQNCILDFTLL